MSSSRIVHVGAVVLDGPRVLMVRQTPTHSLGPVWTIPWGVLDPSESPAAAALRETREEAGITAAVVGLAGVQELPAPWEGTLALVFLCRHVSGSPMPDGLETDAAAYLDQAELRSDDRRFEPWCRWLAELLVDAEPLPVLLPVAGNPFAPQAGYVAAPAIRWVASALREWDPLAVLRGCDTPRHDYDEHVPAIVSMIHRGAPAVEVADHLRHLRLETLGAHRDGEADAEAAARIVEMIRKC